MAQAIRLKKIISSSNSSSHLFEKIHQSGSSYQFEKNLSHSNSSSHPLEKFISRLNGSSYLFKKETVSYFGSCSNKTRQDFKTIHQALLNDACRHVYITQTVVTLLFFVYLCLMTLSSFFTGKRLIHKLLLNWKPYGPYTFVAALEDTRFCLVKEINFKINIAHKINATLYSLQVLRFTMHLV